MGNPDAGKARTDNFTCEKDHMQTVACHVPLFIPAVLAFRTFIPVDTSSWLC